MSDPNIAFSFDGSARQALDLTALQSAIETEAAAVEQEVIPTTPKATAPAPDPITLDADADSTATETQITDPPQARKEEEIRTHKIVVDGQELEVTEADLKAGHMRQRDYTQKTQALAAEKAAIQAEKAQWQQEKAAIASELSQIDQFLRDQNAVRGYMEKAFGVSALSTTPPPQIDPNRPPTAAEVAQIAAYNAEQVRLSMQREVLEARREALAAQQAIAAQQFQERRGSAESAVNAHLSAVLDKYPVLRQMSENIEDELIGDAVRFKPKSVEEAKVKLTEAAERRVAAIRSIAAEEKKQSAIKAAQLKKTSTEKPGGSAPTREPGRKLSLDTADRKDLLAAAEADLRALMGQS